MACECIYLDEDWGPVFVAARSSPIKYLPEDWRHQIEIAPPPVSNDEDCARLVDIVKERPAYRADIVAQAQDRWAAIAPVLAIANLYRPPVKDKTIGMIRALLTEILAPTFIVKFEFKRGRPWQCCTQDLGRMFHRVQPPPPAPQVPLDPLDPLHPAYPSGHSTQAHSVAAVLGLLQPAIAEACWLAADRVARNREVAGLHYPTDSACGAALAKRLVDILVKMPKFIEEQWDPAKEEWA